MVKLTDKESAIYRVFTYHGNVVRLIPADRTLS